MPPYVDHEMAAEAVRLRLPFEYQLRDHGIPCNPQLRMPDGQDFALRGAEAAGTGNILKSGVLYYGCRRPR